MDIDNYLLEGENVKEEMHTEGGDIHKRDWDWGITSERVIKHGSGLLGDEAFHDLSIEKVSGISFESGRENAVLGLGLVFGTAFLILEALPSEIFADFPIPADFFWVIALITVVFFGIIWYDSKSSYLQIHGYDSSDRWKIEVSDSARDSKEVREFAMSLRKEISR
jgi:hypothetical protein